MLLLFNGNDRRPTARDNTAMCEIETEREIEGRSMPIAIEAPGRDEQERRKWAEGVFGYFGKSIPELRLLVWLDETDRPTLQAGDANRGWFAPTDKAHFKGVTWPQTLGDRLQGKTTFHYDALIYLHNSTCESEESAAMTLSHELQHCIQFGFHREPWAVNILLCKVPPPVISELHLAWKDIPPERDARIVAKRACESLLGVGRT